MVDIVGVASNDVSEQACNILTVEANQKITSDDWFDLTLINILYVCAATVQPENNQLAMDIADHNLDLYSNKEVIGDLRSFLGSKKFNKIINIGQIVHAHIVPTYDLQTIKDLSQVMYDRLTLYWANELNQQEQLQNAMARIQDMNVNFQSIEMQQEQYFQMELIMLEEIFAATDNLWNWDWQYRNASDNFIEA